jgi:hypothetical protein
VKILSIGSLPVNFLAVGEGAGAFKSLANNASQGS